MATRVALILVASVFAAGCAAGDSAPVLPDGGASSVSADAGRQTGVRLPFTVDDYFVPSGYMGDGELGGIVRTDTCAETRPGDALGLCHRFVWTMGDKGWAGVFWQFPEGSWGEVPGLAIAAGATEVSFWAWGALGGEQITFIAGMSDVDGFHAELADVALTQTPMFYTIDMTGVGYTDVAGGFAWVADEANEGTTTFYLDGVQWR